MAMSVPCEDLFDVDDIFDTVIKESTPPATRPKAPTPPKTYTPSGKELSLIPMSTVECPEIFPPTHSLTAEQMLYVISVATGSTASAAARRARVSRRDVREWEATNQEFVDILRDATQAFVDTLEEEAYRRAMEGSDRLLIKMLQAHKPEIYSEKKIIDQNVVHSFADLAKQVAASYTVHDTPHTPLELEAPPLDYLDDEEEEEEDIEEV